ncbi:MAG TPA: GTPase Era [Bryobacteraceae bacterium]|jgi:GTP-binding protein Era|nr:GTPase Era [Bryobacteraceae bacterium]
MKSGFVSILGRPNAGKSTLLNQLIGAKIAIVANKPQTTRTSIQGVLTLPDAQIVFLDTPGIHKADSLIGKRMMATVRAALDQRDLLLLVVDVSRKFGMEDRQAVDLIRKADTPALLVLNKTDLLHKDKGTLLPLIEQYRALNEFADYIPLSARSGEGLPELRQAIVARLPEGPAYFPPDFITDQPDRFLAAELIREKILDVTREEVPHSVAVAVDAWEDTPDLIRIYATTYVERAGQKGIIIGAGGAMLKQIGTRARQEMERLFGRHVYLSLHVKVKANWREQPGFLAGLDWRTMAGADEN